MRNCHSKYECLFVSWTKIPEKYLKVLYLKSEDLLKLY